LGSGLEDFVLLAQRLIQFEDRGHIPAPIAVVGSRPHCHELLIEHDPVSFHHQLVSTAYEFDVILSIEFVHYVSSEEVSSSSW
jgi:hypothetical protein